MEGEQWCSVCSLCINQGAHVTWPLFYTGTLGESGVRYHRNCGEQSEKAYKALRMSNHYSALTPLVDGKTRVAALVAVKPREWREKGHVGGLGYRVNWQHLSSYLDGYRFGTVRIQGNFIDLCNWETRPPEQWSDIPVNHIILTWRKPVLDPC